MSVYLSITSSLSPDACDALSFPPSSFDRFSFAGSRPPDNALPLPPSSTVAAACSSGEPEFHVSFGVIKYLFFANFQYTAGSELTDYQGRVKTNGIGTNGWGNGVQRGKKTIYKNYQAEARGKTDKRSDRRVGGNVDKMK